MARAKRPRVARDEAKLVRLSLIELRQVIAVADADRRLWVGALVRLLAVHGLRCGEAIGARVGDLSTADGHRTLGLRRKGGKTSVTPLPSSTAILLDELALGRVDDDLLLDVTYSRAWRAVRRIGEQSGLARLHPHCLRAAFVSHALDAGVPLDRVQAAASHADPRTTMSYDRRTLDLDGHPAHVLAGLVAS